MDFQFQETHPFRFFPVYPRVYEASSYFVSVLGFHVDFILSFSFRRSFTEVMSNSEAAEIRSSLASATSHCRHALTVVLCWSLSCDWPFDITVSDWEHSQGLSLWVQGSDAVWHPVLWRILWNNSFQGFACLFTAVPLCPIQIQVQMGLAEWRHIQNHGSEAGPLCFSQTVWIICPPSPLHFSWDLSRNV